MKGNLFGTLMCAFLIGGCATPASYNIVMVGPYTYVLGAYGESAKLPSNEAKVFLFRQAGAYCQEQGRQMQPITNLARENAVGSYATIEVHFKCIQAKNG